jgi:parvulin-like peptidyl-prolyl isomerase
MRRLRSDLALAREHSEDPGSGANGGELTIAPGETVPEFEQAAYALAPGGISPVIETQFGFHVIELQEKIAGQLAPYEQVQPRIQQFNSEGFRRRSRAPSKS